MFATAYKSQDNLFLKTKKKLIFVVVVKFFWS